MRNGWRFGRSMGEWASRLLVVMRVSRVWQFCFRDPWCLFTARSTMEAAFEPNTRLLLLYVTAVPRYYCCSTWWVGGFFAWWLYPCVRG